MNKVLKKVGLSAVVATFVFGMATTSSALLPQDPDNETAVFSVSSDVFVGATSSATYSDTENYTITLDNTTRNGAVGAGRNQGKTRLTYTKDFKSTNGETHVASTFDATETADTSTPNVKASNKITFNANYEGLNEGTFTGAEKIAYQRCQCADNGNIAGFCNSPQNRVPKAQGNIAAGSSFDVQYAAVTTGADATAIAYSDKDDNYTLLPSLNYNIDARGLGIYGQNDNAIGSVKAGMKANINEQNDNNGGKDTTTMAYEQHTKAKGLVKFSKVMGYKSAVKKGNSASNINSVP